jgi:hypothetical protein
VSQGGSYLKSRYKRAATLTLNHPAMNVSL